MRAFLPVKGRSAPAGVDFFFFFAMILPYDEDLGGIMLSNKRCGFTLIELLVVVLIIGILAAVAVPQYQKAVRKARIAEAEIVLKAFVDACDMYILQHGNYDDISMESLDIEVPTQSKNWVFELIDCAGNGCGVRAIPRWEQGYEIMYYSSNYDGGMYDYNGRLMCVNDETMYEGIEMSFDDPVHIDNPICEGLGGVQSEDWPDAYILP